MSSRATPVQLMPRILVALSAYLHQCYGQYRGIAFVDSTALAVCHNQHQIHQHNCEGQAQSQALRKAKGQVNVVGIMFIRQHSLLFSFVVGTMNISSRTNYAPPVK